MRFAIIESHSDAEIDAALAAEAERDIARLRCRLIVSANEAERAAIKREIRKIARTIPQEATQ